MLSISKLKSISLAITAIVLATIVIIQAIIASLSKYNKQPGIKVPIITYHSVLEDVQKPNDYIISVEQLECDLKYLRNHGYTTILMSDLINYVYNNGTLPEKPIILTFDDGFLNNLTNVLPLLEKYNMKANISVVGYYSYLNSEVKDRNNVFAYLTWDDILDLLRSKRIEIGNHSYNMHSKTSRRAGSTKNSNESEDEYYSLFLRDTLNLQDVLQQKCGYTPQFYTYPFGLYCEQSEKYLKQIGFKATLTCEEKNNYITKEPSCLYLLGRYNRRNNMSTEVFMEDVLKLNE